MNNSELQKPFFAAVAERLSRSAVLLLSDSGRNVFSGTLVEVGDKVCVLTAEHGIAKIEDGNSLRVASMQEPGKYEPISINEIRKSIELDLALFEIPKTSLAQIGGECVSLTGASSFEIVPKALACSLGFPGARFKIAEGDKRTIHPTPFLYATEVTKRMSSIDFTEWEPDPVPEFFIEWDKKNLVNASSNILMEEFEPNGMSGAGIFHVPKMQGERIWSPSSACLAGVVTNVLRKSKMLRCIRIEYALTLLGIPLKIQVIGGNGPV